MAYKINWYFSRENKKDLIKIIKILGSKSLDEIRFLNENGRILNCYASQHLYPFGCSDFITITNINRILRNNKEIETIQIIRK